MSERLAPADPIPAMLATIHDVTGVPASSKVPNPRPDRFVLVLPIGGAGRSNIVKFEGTFAYEAWATSAPDARALAYQTRGALLGLAGTVAADVAFYRVRDVAAPGYLPDPESGQERFTGTIEIVSRETSTT